ncbi:hypothetical protein ACIOUE_39940 [Streptomyces xanthochromogenes]|uniref:hypothetical protein n=1 Tax=Streptomyces xanthochromogenes TaxID=67384 RepID=UPI0037F6AED2
MTDGQLRDGVHRALRCFTQEQPPARQVASITALILRWVRIDWTVPRPSALRLTPASRDGPEEPARLAGGAGLSGVGGLPLSAVAGRLAG